MRFYTNHFDTSTGEIYVKYVHDGFDGNHNYDDNIDYGHNKHGHGSLIFRRSRNWQSTDDLPTIHRRHIYEISMLYMLR